MRLFGSGAFEAGADGVPEVVRAGVESCRD
jgi:hypothetical protein